MAAKYKVGLIGAGRAGVPRARAFDKHPLCEIVAITDTDQANLDLACKRFGVPGYSDWDDMLNNHDLDIGMAVLPVRPNPDAVVALAKSGVKSIFCEKPLAGTLNDADRMVEETASRGIPLICGVVNSSHPDMQTAYKLVADGEIGRVLRINLYDTGNQMGTHGYNLTRRLAGRPAVDHVIGWVSGDPMSETEDEHAEGEPGYGHLGGIYQFTNGVRVSTSYDEYENYRHWKGLEVMGTHGVIWLENTSGRDLRFFKAKSNSAPTSWADLEEVKGLFGPPASRERGFDEDGWRDPGEVMMGIVREMVDNLETGAQLGATTGEDMRYALEIAVAIRESARNGSAPVRFPLTDRSLAMYPQKTRWFYKKTIMGEEAYMAQLAEHKQD